MTAWSAITDGEIDADSPGKAALAQKFVDNNQHLYEFLTGGSTRYDDRIPHDHSALQDLEVSPVCGPNLLNNPCPASTSASGWTFSTLANGSGGTIKATASTAGYMYQDLATYPGDTAVQTMFGTAGSPMVASFFVRLVSGTLTQGQIKFGFDDNGAVVDIRWRILVNWDDVGGSGGTDTTWKRFWAYFDDSGPTSTRYPGNSTDFSTNVRLLFDVDQAFDADIEFTGFMCYQAGGAELLPFNWGPQEFRARKYGQAPSASDGVPTGAPLWDRAVAIDNALQVTLS